MSIPGEDVGATWGRAERVRAVHDGASLIMAERARQILVEGFSVRRDTVVYVKSELLRAAYCYILAAVDPTVMWPEKAVEEKPPEAWPFDASWWKVDMDDPVRSLEKAGALIAAEIDRLLALKEEPT
jgi:hypothetical protein